MARILLQNLVRDIPDARLPVNWADFDFASFSAKKTLWDYQQEALEYALKFFWKYYKDFADYRPHEGPEANRERKRRLWQWYCDNGLQEDFGIDLRRLNHRLASLLREHYDLGQAGLLPYEHFINRMCFWMATGSGKTLVIVKLIELLWRLIKRREIPPNDILVLTHRDDLIEQLKRHVDEFNRARGDFWLLLRELREYAAVKWEKPSLFQEQEMTVFYYRSDNLSDEQKEKLVDFRNYDNDGRWYVLLDEAHKGDKEDSKRQHLYAILSRNGFLFNFSATFTDPRDIATTVFNFNLERFIKEGYGKHIAILKQEMRAFRDKEDYTGEEKQKVVLKALMMAACARGDYEALRDSGDGFYHKPLLLVLVNSVNTEDADLQLFFRELERIGKGEIGDEVWRQAREELLEELRQQPNFMFEEERVVIDENLLARLSYADLLQWVFNSGGSGEIEVLIRPSNRQEIAFKLKTGDRPFALIKIGDISGWLKEKLAGYEINERFEDESYFTRLNEDDSDITILMGSRTFYEGWDSNRPNVICYINIGVGEEAQKFILQSVGRGVRIEPLKNRRKRLLPLYNAGEIPRELFDRLKDRVQPLETLFIFGTNRQVLQTVIERLHQERAKTGERQLTLFEVNPEAKVEGRLLLIPTYKQVERPLAEVRRVARFEVERDEWETMRGFVEAVDDRVLLAFLDNPPELRLTPQHLKILRRSLTAPDEFYKFNGRKFGDLRLLVRQLLNYLSVVPKEFDHLKPLEDEIRHFRHITVTLIDISELEKKAEKVKQYQDPSTIEQMLKEKLKRGEITLDEYTTEIKHVAQIVKEEKFEYNGRRIIIKHLAQHYYLPIMLDEEGKADYIRHIIRTPSEVRFVNGLESYLNQHDNKFRGFDWWLFSKLDESLDEVYLPYYDSMRNRVAHFKPDFIFWFRKDNRYLIAFVDPKGTEHIDWERKVDDYCALFEENGMPKTFYHGDSIVKIHLFLYTDDKNKLPERYRKFWFDSLDEMINYLSACVEGS